MAGPIRNRDMGKYADYLVAFWDGKSIGTKDMIFICNRLVNTERSLFGDRRKIDGCKRL